MKASLLQFLLPLCATAHQISTKNLLALQEKAQSGKLYEAACKLREPYSTYLPVARQNEEGWKCLHQDLIKDTHPVQLVGVTGFANPANPEHRVTSVEHLSNITVEFQYKDGPFGVIQFTSEVDTGAWQGVVHFFEDLFTGDKKIALTFPEPKFILDPVYKKFDEQSRIKKVLWHDVELRPAIDLNRVRVDPQEAWEEAYSYHNDASGKNKYGKQTRFNDPDLHNPMAKGFSKVELRAGKTTDQSSVKQPMYDFYEPNLANPLLKVGAYDDCVADYRDVCVRPPTGKGSHEEYDEMIRKMDKEGKSVFDEYIHQGQHGSPNQRH